MSDTNSTSKPAAPARWEIVRGFWAKVRGHGLVWFCARTAHLVAKLSAARRDELERDGLIREAIPTPAAGAAAPADTDKEN